MLFCAGRVFHGADADQSRACGAGSHRDSAAPGRGGDNFVRWAQLAFHGNWFYLELMDTVLSPGEAECLIQERAGVFYLRDRLDSPSGFNANSAAKLVRDFNPVHKCYRAGDKPGVASDLAYLWFDVWRVPLDWVFHVKMSYFGVGTAEFFSLP